MSYGIELWGNCYEDRLQKFVLIQKKTIRIINKNMIDQTHLPLIRLPYTNNILKYNSIFKLNELITFRIILFLYNLLHNNKIYFTINEKYTIPKHNFFKGPKYYNNLMINNLLKFEMYIIYTN